MATNSARTKRLSDRELALSIEQPKPELTFDSIKVFSATKHNDRAALGELITDWIRAHPGIEIVDKVVTQSSDSEFHCITITLFYRSAP